jgi:MHS family shikimate/dehydroshikimate transporter-like MFS transporter
MSAARTAELEGTVDDRTTVRNRRKAIFAAAAGSTLEWYDFYIYGVASALVFGTLFFPSFDPVVGTLLSFGTFAIGFIARPIGGIIFANLGDRIGRKKILTITLLLMGGATALMGLLPTYENIGIWAPILLLLMRLLQGFGAGAELGGANSLVVEHARPNRRGLSTGYIFMGVAVGLLVSSGIFSIIAALTTDEQFLAWGWRIPFLISIALIALGLWVRLRVAESPAFENLVEEKPAERKIPVVELIRTSKKGLFIVMGARVAENGILFFYSVFLLSYIKQHLELDGTVSTNALSVACVVALFTIPFFAWLSDKYGRKPVLLAGTGFAALSAFPIFMLVNSADPFLITIGITLGVAFAWGSMVGVQGAYFTELFPTRLRFTGYTVGREISSIFAGGLAPFIATGLLVGSGGQWWPVAMYALVMALVGFIALCFGPETFKKDIHE